MTYGNGCKPYPESIEAERDALRDELREARHEIEAKTLLLNDTRSQLDIAEQAIRRQERELRILRTQRGDLIEANQGLVKRVQALDAEVERLKARGPCDDPVFPVLTSLMGHPCDCDQSMIRCDHRGCRCVHCGGYERATSQHDLPETEERD